MSYKLYNILGIEKNASDDEIKKAYKKLAILHHPDKGGDPEKFKEILDAYNILSDKIKREEYDFFGDNEKIINPNIGKKGRNIIQSISITLKEAYFGTTKNIKIISNNLCDKCLNICHNCEGHGMIHRVIANIGITITQEFTCSSCFGKGVVNKKNINCKSCKGNGIIIENKEININIVPGINTGMSLKIDNLGEDNVSFHNNIPIHNPGDLIFVINVESEYDKIKRINDDLIYTYKIPFWQLLCNPKRLYIDHFNISNNILNFDDIIDHHKEYIFENKGMPIFNKQNTFGNLIIKFDVLFPNKKLKSEEINKLMSVFNDLDLVC